MRRRFSLGAVACFLISVSLFAQTPKPKLTLDEFFNSVGFTAVKVSPDGNAVVVGTERADWEQQIFRKELWLYRIAGNGGSLVQLTQSGHDGSPQWSPDGQWISFLSERKTAGGKDADAADDKDKEVSQLFLISPNGGEALAVTSGDDDVHSFAWSPDSKAIYFATRQPWTKQQNDDHKKEWRDVVRYRGDERGDMILRIAIEDALARHAALGTKDIPTTEKESGATPGAVVVARTPLHVEHLSNSRDGNRLAFVSNSVSRRQEKVEDIEIYLMNLSGDSAEAAPNRITKNEAGETNLEWAPDNRHIWFQVNVGSLEGKYEDPQPRLYWVDSDTRKVERWFADYKGEVGRYTPLPDGSVVCACRVGTEIQLQSQANPKASIMKREGWPGTYDSRTRQRSGRPRFTSPTVQTSWRRRGPSHRSTNYSRNAICPRRNRTSGSPTTAQPSKAC